MNGHNQLLTDEHMRIVMCMTEAYSDDADYAHIIRMGRAVESAVCAPKMAAALDLIVRRLQASIDDGSRPDQWSMEDLVNKAKDALPASWVIGAA